MKDEGMTSSSDILRSRAMSGYHIPHHILCEHIQTKQEAFYLAFFWRYL